MADLGSFSNPAWTWNLFATLGGMGVLGWWIKLLLSKNDEKVKEAVALKDALFQQSLDSIKASIEDWQTGARDRTAALCKKIDDIAKDVKERVHVTHCNDRHSTVRDEIHELKQRMHQ